MLELPSTAVRIGNSAVPPGKLSVAAAGSCPSAFFTTSLTAPPVIVTCAVTCFPVEGRDRPRPEYSLDVLRAHCCIRQEITASVGGQLTEAGRMSRLGGGPQSCDGGIHSLIGRGQREAHVFGVMDPVEVARTGDDAQLGEATDR